MDIWGDFSQGRPGGAFLKAAGFTGVIRYVGISVESKRLTREEYQDLVAHGIKVLGVVESTTTEDDRGYQAGVADATAAKQDIAAITGGAGLPFVFASNDKTTFVAADVDYVRGFRDVLGHEKTGAYGFASFLTAVHSAGLAAAYWQAGEPPSVTHTAGFVNFWQRQGYPHPAPPDGPSNPPTQKVNGVELDVDNALLPLPVGQPGPTPVPPPPPTPVPPAPPAPKPVATGPEVFGSPVVVEPSGALSAYARGIAPDVVLWSWQVAAGQHWVGWLRLGGDPAGEPVAAREHTGGTALFVRDHKGAIGTASGANGKWTGWTDLGGTLAGDPVALVRQDGSIALFAVGTDSQLHTAVQAGQGGHWSAWTALGGELTGKPAVAPGAGEAISVFARGKDGQVQSSTQRGAGAGWTPWASLGVSLLGDPVAVTHPDHSVTLFGIGQDHQCYTAKPDAAGTHWTSLGGQFTGTPAALLTPAGLWVFARSLDDRIEVAHQGAANDGWSEWRSVAEGVAGEPIAVAKPDGTITVLGVGYDGELSAAVQSAPDGDWPEWGRTIDSLLAA